jgi:hypothetical protein
MKRLALILVSGLLVVMVLAIGMAQGAPWVGNVGSTADCDGVTVTANPEVYNEDASGRDRVRWVGDMVDGAGFFPWSGATSLSGDVFVTWKKQTSSDSGLTWMDAGPTHTEQYSWAERRSDGCPVVPTLEPTLVPTPEPGVNWLRAWGEVDCKASTWRLYAEASKGVSLTPHPAWEGSMGDLASVEVNIDADWESGEPRHIGQTVTIERECDVPATVVPKPTRTIAATSTPRPSGCSDRQGKWQLKGYLYGLDGKLLRTEFGNVYHVYFRLVKTESGVEVGDLGLQDFPVFADGAFGGGFPVNQNLVLGWVKVFAGGVTYNAVAKVVHGETGQPLTDQPEYAGTYCGAVSVSVWLEAPER